MRTLQSSIAVHSHRWSACPAATSPQLREAFTYLFAPSFEPCGPRVVAIARRYRPVQAPRSSPDLLTAMAKGVVAPGAAPYYPARTNRGRVRPTISSEFFGEVVGLGLTRRRRCVARVRRPPGETPRPPKREVRDPKACVSQKAASSVDLAAKGRSGELTANNCRK